MKNEGCSRVSKSSVLKHQDFIETFVKMSDQYYYLIKSYSIEIPDKISDHSGVWVNFDTVNFSRGPGLWRFNISYFNDPDFQDIVYDVV